MTDIDVLAYRAFDVYFNANIDTKHLPFMTNSEDDNTRINNLINITKDINTECLYTDTHTTDLTLNISTKEFKLAVAESNVFNKSKIIWEQFTFGSAEYKYDGLIYTPADKPVGYNNMDINYDLYTGKTWELNLKWKPEYENTIDFLIKEE